MLRQLWWIFTAKVDGVCVFFIQVRGNTGHGCLIDIVKGGTKLQYRLQITHPITP